MTHDTLDFLNEVHASIEEWNRSNDCYPQPEADEDNWTQWMDSRVGTTFTLFDFNHPCWLMSQKECEDRSFAGNWWEYPSWLGEDQSVYNRAVSYGMAA